MTCALSAWVVVPGRQGDHPGDERAQNSGLTTDPYAGWALQTSRQPSHRSRVQLIAVQGAKSLQSRPNASAQNPQPADHLLSATPEPTSHSAITNAPTSRSRPNSARVDGAQAPCYIPEITAVQQLMRNQGPHPCPLPEPSQAGELELAFGDSSATQLPPYRTPSPVESED